MLIEVVVEQGGNHVVGGSDGVEVTSEMEVDLLHGQHLSVSASGSSALHAEAGAKRRLAQSYACAATDGVKSESQTDAHCGFADTGTCGRDGCHKDELALLLPGVANE